MRLTPIGVAVMLRRGGVGVVTITSSSPRSNCTNSSASLPKATDTPTSSPTRAGRTSAVKNSGLEPKRTGGGGADAPEASRSRNTDSSPSSGSATRA